MSDMILDDVILTPADRDDLADAIMAYGYARAFAMTSLAARDQRAADDAADAAWAQVLWILYPLARDGDQPPRLQPVPAPMTPVTYLPRALLNDACAAPDCYETKGLRQDGEHAYCEDHR